MIEIRDLIRDFKSKSREEFLAVYRTPVLLHQTDQEYNPDRDFRAKTQRVTARPTAVMAQPLHVLEMAADASGVLVFPVVARAGRSSHVVVGRTEPCDVRLPYDGVSVRHAILHGSGGNWHIIDLDATNGTYLDGRRIQPNVPVTVRSGNRIKLGTAEVIFYDPPGLYDYLERLTGA